MPMQNALISAISRAARKAPGTDPRPPTTTTTKTSAMTDRSRQQVRRLARYLQRAASAGEQRAEREHCGEQPFLIDAERTRHLPVLGRGAHQRSPARARQKEVEGDENEGAEHDQKQVVLREPVPDDRHRRVEAGGARAEQVLGAPDPEREVLDDEHEREGGEQLQQFGGGVEAAQHKHLDQQRPGARRRPPRPGWRPRNHGTVAEPLDQAVRQIQPQHVKGSVGEIDDPSDAENQG